MKKKLILHIPHSSSHFPDKEGFIATDRCLEELVIKLTDWHTEDIYYSKDDERVIANFSRIYCDPERFSDDKKEIMAQYGMGVLYENSDSGELIRTISPALKKRVLNECYYPHHKNLKEVVEAEIIRHGEALILDCHSYPDTPFFMDLDQRPNRPDFNIGTDPFHTPKELIKLSVEFFEKKGYSLGIDWPYKGTLVPMEYYHKEKKVQSIMLEINRMLYLKNNTNEKSEQYAKTKRVVQEYMNLIRKTL